MGYISDIGAGTSVQILTGSGGVGSEYYDEKVWTKSGADLTISGMVFRGGGEMLQTEQGLLKQADAHGFFEPNVLAGFVNMSGAKVRVFDQNQWFRVVTAVTHDNAIYGSSHDFTTLELEPSGSFL